MMGLTADQMKSFRKQLTEERQRILFNVEALREEFTATLGSDTADNGLETHIGDQGTDTFLRERDLTLAEHEESMLREIDSAIARVDDGSFGVCEADGIPIATDRLEAQPWARTCVEHAPS